MKKKDNIGILGHFIDVKFSYGEDAMTILQIKNARVSSIAVRIERENAANATECRNTYLKE